MSTPETTKPRVLVIDDEVAILKAVQMLLTRAGYEVTIAESGAEGLGILGKWEHHCVITDAVMPEMTGYEFVTAARSDPRYAQLPILMLTRKRHRQDVKKAVEAGVTDYILKPIDENLLFEKVESCIKRKSGRPAPAPVIPSEYAPEGTLAEAEVSLTCQVLTLTETSLSLLLPVRVTERMPLKIRSRVFSDIGVDQPRLRVESCERADGDESTVDALWRATVSFATAPEADLAKIKAWLQKQPKGR